MNYTQSNASVKKKVLVSGHDLKFWRPLQAELEKTGLFEFREDEWPGHNEHDPKQTLSMMEWADIIMAEWTLGNAVFCANHKKPHQRLVTRLHLQERGTVYPEQLNYDQVDLVVFVGPHILEECVQKFKMPREKVCVIGNFLDYNKYHLSKFGGNEFNLGVIGTVPARKRMDLAVETLQRLLEKDDRYMLHIKGPSPQEYDWLWARTKEREYYQEVYEKINSGDLRYKIIFDPAGNDVHHWFQKIGYLLSPSDFESFHMAVAEGICSDAIPVVWNWEGASSIYPMLELYKTPAAAAAFIDFLRTSDSRSGMIEQNGNFIKNNYDAAVIRDKWIEALLPSGDMKIKSSQNGQKKAVLVVYAIDSWGTFHRREMIEALAENLVGEIDILVVEPGSHFQTLKNKNLCEEGELKRFAGLIPTQVSANIYKIRILTGSFPADIDVNPGLKNAKTYEEAIQTAVKHIFASNIPVIHWIYKPEQRKLAVNDQPFVYEVYDEYTMDFGTGAVYTNVAELEPRVLEEASHVFFTSDPLAERKKIHCRSWSVVGNGVAFDVFDQYRTTSEPSARLRQSVGYLGNLSDFFDWELMLTVCREIKEVDFFFHGQIEHHRLESEKETVERLMGLPNTYFSGRVSRQVGAAAINRYDALIIPFVVNEAMHAVNPLKLWEYFATGKPVVSSPMDAVKISSPLLLVADGLESWKEMIHRALSESKSPSENYEERVRLAKENAWYTLTKEHAKIILGIC